MADQRFHSRTRNQRDAFGWLLLIIAVMFTAFVIAVVFPALAHAEGVEYTGDTKPFNCIDPDALEDGEPLTAAIQSVKVFVRKNIGEEPLQTIIMGGGCQRMVVDISSIGYGQFYQDGIAYLEDGRESAVSPPLPFSRKSMARPNSPIMTE